MIDLLYKMLRIRMVEEAIADNYSKQKMRCPTHLSIGQEAIAVGVSECLTPEDVVMSNHRAHAHYLAKGGDLKRMIAEIHGKEGGCSRGRGGSMHLVDRAVGMLGSTPIVGGSIPVATGIAFAALLKGEKRITVSYFGEGATEEGVFAESLNFAALKRVPILYVCEDNLYSVYSPLSVRQSPKRDLAMLAKANGMVAFEGDGNQIEACLKVTKEATDHIRNGNGPAFIKLSTYRFREHCGPCFDHHLNYRSEEEINYHLSRCPIATYQNKLLEKKLLSQDELVKMKETISNEIEEAFAFAESSPYPEFDPESEGALA